MPYKSAARKKLKGGASWGNKMQVSRKEDVKKRALMMFARHNASQKQLKDRLLMYKYLPDKHIQKRLMDNDNKMVQDVIKMGVVKGLQLSQNNVLQFRKEQQDKQEAEWKRKKPWNHAQLKVWEKQRPYRSGQVIQHDQQDVAGTEDVAEKYANGEIDISTALSYLTPKNQELFFEMIIEHIEQDVDVFDTVDIREIRFSDPTETRSFVAMINDIKKNKLRSTFLNIPISLKAQYVDILMAGMQQADMIEGQIMQNGGALISKRQRRLMLMNNNSRGVENSYARGAENRYDPHGANLRESTVNQAKRFTSLVKKEKELDDIKALRRDIKVNLKDLTDKRRQQSNERIRQYMEARGLPAPKSKRTSSRQQQDDQQYDELRRLSRLSMRQLQEPEIEKEHEREKTLTRLRAIELSKRDQRDKLELERALSRRNKLDELERALSRRNKLDDFEIALSRRSKWDERDEPDELIKAFIRRSKRDDDDDDDDEPYRKDSRKSLFSRHSRNRY